MSAGPTLTDATGMGGINALNGFDYQAWNTLLRIPDWLVQPSFEGVIFEGLDDIEARFFNPYMTQQALLERFQAKSGSLDKADLKKVFHSFKAFSERHPGAARLHTLITAALPSTLMWVQRDSERIRNAKPFYSPFPTIIYDSSDAHAIELEKEFGADLACFISNDIGIDLSSINNTRDAQFAFGSLLQQVFTELDASIRHINEAFVALIELLGRERGTFITKTQILGVLNNKLGERLIANEVLSVHLKSDRDEEKRNAIEIGTNFFTGAGDSFPDNIVWQEKLIKPLQNVSSWAHKAKYVQIDLSGSYRLSTAFIVGWAFRSAIGFEINIPTREGNWLTNDRPVNYDAYPQWQIIDATRLNGDRLSISIGVIRDPSSDLVALTAVPAEANQSAWLPEPLSSAKDAQASAMKIKKAISKTVSKLSPKFIDLYYAGPAAFAVALGHRWNGMPLTQLHEFNSNSRRYQPTAII